MKSLKQVRTSTGAYFSTFFLSFFFFLEEWERKQMEAIHSDEFIK